jgi:uncharacterized protein (TIGR00251 family)
VPWAQAADGGAVLRVHARPGAARPGIAGTHGESIAVRVRARAVEGRANAELLDVLATALDVPPSAVRLASGAHGREKRIRIDGLDVATVIARLAKHLLR